MNNLKFLNKKGDKILSIYWFAILAIVAVGIVAMVIVFYGKPYDVREAEAGIMINKIVDCLSDSNGKIKQVGNLEECYFNFKSDGEFYLEIESLGIFGGNSNLKDNCGKAENIICVERNAYFLDENNNGIIIKLLSIVNKEA